ncbi:alpha/beta fold hydrolase [Aeromicrobium sp.]|uniref:alpha/beta fold hydrolase n=1 Tax=Aeromicrobium sp. TaxID=1871063 RepID=UPI0019B53C86|nr:alpha/beta fold hydrolase [Aeromicrobium sp.]MBC7630042.1 alpha/beta fold hydrolase [Aeromicrobium sp.]
MSEQRVSHYRNGRLTFDVIDSGPLDGIPVVLLHGFPQRASSWSAVSEHLHDHGLRTIAPDQRGYSPGARPRSRFGYRISGLVSDVVALMSAIGPGPVHLVGHDWGAAVAWSVAGAHPDRVSSLTAVSVPHPGAFLRSMLSSNQALKSYYMALFQLPVVPGLILAARGGRGDELLRRAGMTRSMIETFHDDVVDHGALPGGLGYYRSMMLSAPTQFGRKVSVPTTYIWSDGDVALGRKGADLTKNFVSGPYDFTIIEGASHWLPDERPEEIAASIIARIGV